MIAARDRHADSLENIRLRFLVGCATKMTTTKFFTCISKISDDVKSPKRDEAAAEREVWFGRL